MNINDCSTFFRKEHSIEESICRRKKVFPSLPCNSTQSRKIGRQQLERKSKDKRTANASWPYNQRGSEEIRKRPGPADPGGPQRLIFSEEKRRKKSRTPFFYPRRKLRSSVGSEFLFPWDWEWKTENKYGNLQTLFFSSSGEGKTLKRQI